jgi:hypothetical protein
VDHALIRVVCDLQKALEAIIIILGFFEILYTLSLHAGVLGDKYGPTYA